MRYLFLILMLVSCTAKVDKMKECKTQCPTESMGGEHRNMCVFTCERKDLESFLKSKYEQLENEVLEYVKSRHYEFIGEGE